MIGTYWAGRVDEISMRSQTAGGPRRTAYVTHETVMTERDPVVISRFMGDNEDPKNWKPAAAKNTKVCVRVTGASMENGVMKLRGVVEPLV